MSTSQPVSAGAGESPWLRNLYQQHLPWLIVLYLAASPYLFYLLGVSGGISRMLWFVLLLPSLLVIFSNPVGYGRFVLGNVTLLLMIGWLAVTAFWSPLPLYTIKRVFFYLIVLINLSAIVYAGNDPSSVHRALLKTTVVVLLLSMVSFVLTPELSVTFLGFAGIFDHKNTAGMWLLILLFAVLFDYRSTSLLPRLRHFLLLAGVITFMVLSKSKTSMAVGAMLTIFYFVSVRIWRQSPSIRLLYNGCMLLTVLGFWLFYHYQGYVLADFVYDNFGTFTGRDKLWNAARVFIDQHYWGGYGYGAMWDIDDNPEPIMQLKGYWHWVYTNQFHNGYVEMRVQAGMVGMLLLFAYLARNLYNGYRLLCDETYEHRKTAAMLFCCLMGMMIHNLTESTFFVPSSFHGVLYVWFALWLEKATIERKARRAALVAADTRLAEEQMQQQPMPVTMPRPLQL